MSLTLDQYLALLETADDRVNRANAALLKDAGDDLTAYAQSIEFRQSGNMADSTHDLGPFAIGDGILELTIQSAAPYADIVATFDAAHDWPDRVIDEQAARINQLQRDVGDALVRALTGFDAA